MVLDLRHQQAVERGALRRAGAREVPRKDLDALTEHVRRYGAGGLVWAFVQEDGTWRSPIANEARYASSRAAAAEIPSTTSVAAKAEPASGRCHGPPTTRLPISAPTTSAAATGASLGRIERRGDLCGRTTRSRERGRSVCAPTAAMTSSTRSGTAGATSNRTASRNRYAPR